MSDPVQPVAPKSAGDALGQAVAEPGTISVDCGGTVAEADVKAAGPLGVRIDRLRVCPTTHGPVDLHQRATGIVERVRPGGERLDAVEVDPQLGGGVLRTTPDDIRDGRYFEVGIRPDGEAEVRRLQVDPDSGERTQTPFDLTRRQLEALVDGLAEAGLEGPDE